METTELNPQSKSTEIYPKELTELIRPFSSDTSSHRIAKLVEPFDAEEHNLRDIYIISCQEHRVQPNKQILRQLSPVIGKEWLKKVRVLDFSLVYLGSDGCSALIPVIAFSSSLTHLIMPSVGLIGESARSLFALAQVHPSLTWIDVSGNHLDDNVGRCILNTVLENHHIHFLILHDTGISFPIIRKIEHHLESRGKGHNSEHNQFSQTLELGRFSSLENSFSTTCALSTVSTRTRRLPRFVATGLVELRHRLYQNRYCLDYVYQCFILPPSKDDDNDNDNDEDDDDNVKSLMDFRKINDQWDTVSISTMQSGRCSWRAFFRGLRLLGIHAVSHSLTESVIFATSCGICNLETISFGKLLSFLRPHVAIKEVLSRKSSASMRTSFSCLPNVYSSSSVRTKRGEHLPSIVSKPSPTITPLRLMKCTKNTIGLVNSREYNIMNKENVSKNLDGLLKGNQSSRRVSFSCTSVDLSLGLSHSIKSLPSSTKTLEERFELDRFFTSRSVQYVVDRLFDAQNALREYFQPSDKLETTTPQLIPLDEVLRSALFFVGEDHYEIVKTFLEPWIVNIDGCIQVDTEGWLGSMYIPDSKSPNGIPFSLSEEKCMWKTVEVDALICAINQW